jgi:hypothetical protein
VGERAPRRAALLVLLVLLCSALRQVAVVYVPQQALRRRI